MAGGGMTTSVDHGMPTDQELLKALAEISIEAQYRAQPAAFIVDGLTLEGDGFSIECSLLARKGPDGKVQDRAAFRRNALATIAYLEALPERLAARVAPPREASIPS